MNRQLKISVSYAFLSFSLSLLYCINAANDWSKSDSPSRMRTLDKKGTFIFIVISIFHWIVIDGQQNKIKKRYGSAHTHTHQPLLLLFAVCVNCMCQSSIYLVLCIDSCFCVSYCVRYGWGVYKLFYYSHSCNFFSQQQLQQPFPIVNNIRIAHRDVDVDYDFDSITSMCGVQQLNEYKFIWMGKL